MAERYVLNTLLLISRIFRNPPWEAVPTLIALELERIALRLLNKRPSQRYAGAEELVLELRDFLNRAA